MSTVEPRGATERTKTALVLSAGAPHSPLMAGAVCALHCALREEKKTFDIIYTSGAGALIGLLLAAPKCKDPEKALRSIVEFGVSDPIYSLLPVNYKVFHKPGPFTRPVQQLARLFKLGEEFPFQPIPDPVSPLGYWYNYWAGAGRAWREASGGGFRRLYNDLVDLWAAAITPTTLGPWSKGLCQPLPFLEDLVDFKELNKIPNDFFLNIMSLQDARNAELETGQSGASKGARLIRDKDITPKHVRAAFAFPFIYEPVEIDGEPLFEGANRDPISFGNLLTKGDVGVARIKTVVLVDILAQLGPLLLREARDLWDAFGLSIIVPVVAHAQRELARFKKSFAAGEHKFDFMEVKFKLDQTFAAQLTDWSHSNMSRLFEEGYRAGDEFCRSKDGQKLLSGR